MITRNIKLILAYDGTAYAGFQRQPGLLTIQSVIEERLEQLTGGRVRVTAAGRTDAGVHALGQVVNFRTLSSIPTASFVPALNSLLPADIAILAAGEMPESFHARYDAKSKTYTYRIWRLPVRPVFERDRVYHYSRPLDLSALAAASRLLLGRHDFACFCSSGSSVKTSTRTITRADWEDLGEILAFTVTADGFLYRMVRNIVGSLLQVGLGRRPPEWIAGLMASRDRSSAGPTVPAGGLFLTSVEY